MVKNKAVFLRNSERSDYKRCYWRWHKGWVLEIKPNYTKPALRFGDLIHKALEAYYLPGLKRGPHPAKTFNTLYAIQREDTYGFGVRQEDDEWVNAEELGPEMLENYIEEYGRDKRYKVIAPEQPIQVDIGHPKTGKHMFTAVGTLDVVMLDRDTGKIIIMDHKTAKSITTGHLEIDEQAGTYWAIGPEWLRQKGILKPDQTIDHILYNFLRKAKADDRKFKVDERTGKRLYLNLNGEVSKRQPSSLFERFPVIRTPEDRENILWRMRAEYWEMQKRRSGELPIYKTPTRDCAWDCEAYELCVLHEHGADWQELAEATMRKWEPYNAHNMYQRDSQDHTPEEELVGP